MQVNIEKRNLYILAGLLFILGIFTVFAATPFSANLGFHSLQQISTDETGVTSVDTNSNGIIDTVDNTNKLGGMAPSSFCKSAGTGGANCPDLSGVDDEDFCKSDGTDCSYAEYASNSDKLGGLFKNSFCKSAGTECPNFGDGGVGLFKLGGFYSKTGSTCNVVNPATGACTCPAGYEEDIFESPIYMCWKSDEVLPPNPLTWGPGVYQDSICASYEGEGYIWGDSEGFSCISAGATQGYALGGSSCGIEVVTYTRFIQTCGEW